MNQTLEAMLRYQEEDGKLFGLEQELDADPHFRAAKKAQQAAIVARTQIDTCEKRSGEINAAIDRAAARFEEVKKELEELRIGVEESTIDDDVEYSENKLNKLEAALAALERELSELYAQAKEQFETFNSARATMKAAREKLEEEKKAYESIALAPRKAEMDALRATLAKLEKEVDPSLIEKYKRNRRERRIPAFVAVRKDGTTYRCPTCRMELPLNTIETLKRECFVECESCHRIIYSED